MPFYIGRSADGSDMEEFGGMYVNPKNTNEWSSQPYPEQQRFINMNNIVFEYMNGRYTLDDVYNQIKNKTCPLSRNVREYVLSHYNDEGDFIVGGE